MKYLMLSLLVLTACAKPKSAEPLTPVYVYGDSISAGFDVNRPTYAEIVIPKLHGKMTNKSYGATSMFDQNSQGNPAQYSLIINETWEANSIIMWAPGVNDAILHGADPSYLVQYQQAFTDVLNKIHASHLRAFIGTPNHTCDEVRFVTNNVVDVYANITRQLVANMNDQNIKLVDYNQGFVPTVNNTMDCYHLNKTGYEEMANYFLLK